MDILNLRLGACFRAVSLLFMYFPLGDTRSRNKSSEELAARNCQAAAAITVYGPLSLHLCGLRARSCMPELGDVKEVVAESQLVDK